MERSGEGGARNLTGQNSGHDDADFACGADADFGWPVKRVSGFESGRNLCCGSKVPHLPKQMSLADVRRLFAQFNHERQVKFQVSADRLMVFALMRKYGEAAGLPEQLRLAEAFDWYAPRMVKILERSEWVKSYDGF
jgi:hypothetical protein